MFCRPILTILIRKYFASCSVGEGPLEGVPNTLLNQCQIMMLNLLACVSVLEVSSGEYGSYKDILTEKINNGKNRDWRKTEHNCKLHFCLPLSYYCLKNVHNNQDLGSIFIKLNSVFNN